MRQLAYEESHLVEEKMLEKLLLPSKHGYEQCEKTLNRDSLREIQTEQVQQWLSWLALVDVELLTWKKNVEVEVYTRKVKSQVVQTQR
jgi:hypothetical protein